MTTLTEIQRLCHAVSRFQAMQQWQFKAVPVICWEFADLAHFYQAKASLCRTIMEDPYLSTQPFQPVERNLDAHTVEIDAMGVIFRLRCLQQLMTPAGAKGATEVKWTYPNNPDDWNGSEIWHTQKPPG